MDDRLSYKNEGTRESTYFFPVGATAPTPEAPRKKMSVDISIYKKIKKTQWASEHQAAVLAALLCPALLLHCCSAI